MQKSTRSQQGLGFLEQVGLVGGTSTLSHEHKLVLIAGNGEQIDLGGKVGLGVHFFVHVQRSILGVTEIQLGVGVVATDN